MAALANSEHVLTLLQQNDTTTTTANFSKLNLGDTHIIQICQALTHNVHCTDLDLSSNAFGLDGLFAIANLIACNCTLTKIDLSFNTLHSRGALALSRVVSSSNLKSLMLQNCGPSTALILMAMMRSPTTWNTINTSLNPVTNAMMQNSISSENKRRRDFEKPQSKRKSN